MQSPRLIAPVYFDDPAAALDQVRAIYHSIIHHLRDGLQRFVGGEQLSGHVRACYPFVRVHTDTVVRGYFPLSYGFVSRPTVSGSGYRTAPCCA